MRWKQVASVLWLVGLAGCPHAFGRGGTLERAAAKDTKENLGPALPKCTGQRRRELCPDGQPRSKECLRVCGDVLEEEEEDW
jgi:hypothetical protein